MVHLDAVRSSNSILVKSHPLVAVFVGGTTGIGEFAVRALATTHGKEGGKSLRVYIVGRNANAAAKIISECTKVCPKGQFIFTPAKDLSLLTDVDLVCAEIIKLETKNAETEIPKIDMLYMTQGRLIFGPRLETTEGLDTTMSLLYYSRMRFIIKLQPLLLASKLPSHIISVYAAGHEGTLFKEDLSLRNPKHYSFANCRSHVTFMTTLFMEALAEQHPGRMSLIHIFPGVVITDAYYSESHPWWFKAAWWLLGPFVSRFMAIPATESGERMVFLSGGIYPARDAARDGVDAVGEGNVQVAEGTDGRKASGAYAVNWNGDAIALKDTYAKVGKQELAEMVWEHTLAAFRDIETKGSFLE